MASNLTKLDRSHFTSQMNEALEQVYTHTFQEFDNVIELTGNDAGHIATAAEKAAREALLELLNSNPHKLEPQPDESVCLSD